MNTERNERQDERLACRTRACAPVEVDCSGWESDIPESQWSTGKLVSVARVLPHTDVEIETNDKKPAR